MPNGFKDVRLKLVGPARRSPARNVRPASLDSFAGRPKRVRPEKAVQPGKIVLGKPRGRLTADLPPKPDLSGSLIGEGERLHPRTGEVEARRAEAPAVADERPEAPGPPMKVDAAGIKKTRVAAGMERPGFLFWFDIVWRPAEALP